MYKIISQGYRKEFKIRKQLIAYIAESNHFSGTEFYNGVLDDAAVNSGDTKRVATGYTKDSNVFFEYTFKYIPRTTFILDEFNNNLYCKAFIAEVRNYKFDKPRKKYNPYFFKNGRNFRYSFSHKQTSSFIYRKDPVPGTGKCKGYMCYRNVSIHHKLKYAYNPEHKEYNRHNDIEYVYGFTWDKPYRQITKSWKNQSKKRHQWE